MRLNRFFYSKSRICKDYFGVELTTLAFLCAAVVNPFLILIAIDLSARGEYACSAFAAALVVGFIAYIVADYIGRNRMDIAPDRDYTHPDSPYYEEPDEDDIY